MCLRQGIRSFVFDRILRGNHHEGLRQRTRHAIDRDLPFFHRFEQRCLSFRGSAVDFVGQQQIGEHRPLSKAELRGARVVNQRAGDVARHEVGGELKSLRVERERGGERSHQQRFRHAGHAFEQHVAVGEQRDDDAAHDGVLPDNGLGHLRTDADKCLPTLLALLGRHHAHEPRTSCSSLASWPASATSSRSLPGVGPYSTVSISRAGLPVRREIASDNASL